MYARYAFMFDEEDTILPFRDASTCEKRLNPVVDGCCVVVFCWGRDPKQDTRSQV